MDHGSNYEDELALRERIYAEADDEVRAVLVGVWGKTLTKNMPWDCVSDSEQEKRLAETLAAVGWRRLRGPQPIPDPGPDETLTAEERKRLAWRMDKRRQRMSGSTPEPTVLQVPLDYIIDRIDPTIETLAEYWRDPYDEPNPFWRRGQ